MRERVLLISLLVILMPLHTQGASRQQKAFNPISVASPIMAIAPDSRSSGMGDAGVASTPDANSQHWNIAKYPFMESDIGIGISYTPWLFNLGLRDVSISYVPMYYKIDKQQSVSASVRYFSLGSMVLRNIDGDKTGEVYPNEFALDVGYARKFTPYFGMGMAFRYIRSDLTGGYVAEEAYTVFNPGNGFAFDLGLYGEKNLDKNHSFGYGLVFSNVGTKIQYSEAQAESFFLPMTLRIGGRYTLQIDNDNSISAMLDLSKLLVPTPPVRDIDGSIILGKDNQIDNVPLAILQSFYDAPYGFSEEMSEIMIGTGIEYKFKKLFAFRTGYFHDSERKGNRRYFTFGASISYNFVSLDFSYLASMRGQKDPLANTLRISLIFNFTIPKAGANWR